MKRKRNLCLTLATSCLLVQAQLPRTELKLFRIEQEKGGAYHTGTPETIGSRKGYNNQPAFTPDARQVIYAGDSLGQTDIYMYQIKGRKTTRLTMTRESEYSPYLLHKEMLAAVAVEADSSQRIHLINMATGKMSARLWNDSIGYYAFLNADTIVFYKLTGPSHSLWWRTLNDSAEHFLARSPTRTFRAVNRHTLIYGIKDSAAVHYLVYDFLLLKASRFASLRPGSEDIFWHPTLGLLVSRGKAILRYDQKTASWVTLLDLSAQGVHRISRFALDDRCRQLVVVDNFD